MDFDSIISFLLIILFFAFPALLKRFNKRKKNTAISNPAEKARKLSLFEKLGDQIRQYAENLEQEAAKGKQPRETQENIWDQLAGEEDFQDTYEASPEEAFVPVVQPPVSAADLVMPVKEKVRPAPTPEKQVFVQQPSLTTIFGQPKFSSNQLQQAVIWSEILSKPIALR
ncbi:MAG: hypothetical protein PF503_09115 [Desulfobacula sp.]|jgi:hypothetical protein|nr:hypothetical protein [Desulfobacula sp.]